MTGPLRVTRSVVIPERDLTWRFSRSSGPGGQSVNTADSRVELSLDVARTTALGPVQRARVLERLSRRLVDGVLTVKASEHRSQLRNREAALGRMAKTLAGALAPPPPRRRPTKPTRGAVERRLADKKRRARTKRLRRSERGLRGVSSRDAEPLAARRALHRRPGGGPGVRVGLRLRRTAERARRSRRDRSWRVAGDPGVLQIDRTARLDQQVPGGLGLLEGGLRERDERELHVVQVHRLRRDRAERVGHLTLPSLRPPGQQDGRTLDLVVPARSVAHRLPPSRPNDARQCRARVDVASTACHHPAGRSPR